MSQIKVTTRGNEVQWSATFLDFGGVPTPVPGAAKLYIVFPNGEVALTMGVDGAAYVATWDSSVSSKGTVSWSIRADHPSVAADGSFEISANPANPEPA